MNEDKQPLSTQDIAAGREEARTQESSQSESESNYAQSGTQGAAKRPLSGQVSTNGAQFRNETSPSSPALMPDDTAQTHREHWSEIQVRFVDDPKDAVQQADELVAEVIQNVAAQFAEQRKSLESKWQGGGEASSEDLRQALLQYRSFFERLLAA